jgi:hypothetical protein
MESELQLKLEVISNAGIPEAISKAAEVEKIFQALTGHYEHLYYTGLLHERRAKAQMQVGRPLRALAPLFEAAMRRFEEEEKIRPSDNDDAILRWNRCARLLQSHRGFREEKDFEGFDAHDSSPV